MQTLLDHPEIGDSKEDRPNAIFSLHERLFTGYVSRVMFVDRVKIHARGGPDIARGGLAAPLLSFCLFAVALGLYLPSLQGDFVYDSRPQVLTDSTIHQYRNLWDVVSFRVLSLDVLDNTRPVHLFSLMIDSLFWGKTPAGYHLTNVLLHAANTVLLFWFILRLFRPGVPTMKELLIAGLGALLFAVHPVNSEAVCEVSYREDLLAAFFILLGLNLATRFTGRRNVLLGLGCCLCFLLSVASKETGIAGPPLLFLYLVFFRREERRAAWAWLIVGASLVVFAFLIARFSLQPSESFISPDHPKYLGGSFPEMLKIEPRIWTFSLGLILWPSQLCADYGPYSIRNITLTGAWLVLMGVVVLHWLFVRRSRMLFWGAAAYWLALLPVLNLVPIFQALADRFLYLPLVGVSVLIAGLLSHQRLWSKKWMGMIAMGLFVLVCIEFSFLTLSRERVWHDQVSLWRDTLRKNPASWPAANNLGFALFDQGDFAQALASWRQAIQLSKGQMADSWAGFAVGLEAQGQSKEADQAYRRAIRLDPRYRHPKLLVESLRWERGQAQKLEVLADRVNSRS